jgi:chemotaxis protein methyltransferase WspC
MEPAETKTAPRHHHHHRVAPKHLPPAQRKVDGRPLPPFVAKPKAKASPQSPSQTKTESPPDLATELAEIRKLADAGQFEAAIKKCSACLQTHGPSSHTFYLLGLVNDASGNVAHAGDFYRKAVYLEPDHYESLAQLSLLAKKSGDAAAARQWSQRAQRAHEKQAARHERSHSRS